MAKNLKENQENTENAIREIRRVCDEALEHSIGWTMFANIVKTKIDRETELRRLLHEIKKA